MEVTDTYKRGSQVAAPYDTALHWLYFAFI